MEKFAYLKSVNAEYIEMLYEQYLQSPDSIDPTWRWFFEGMELGSEENSKKSSLNGHTNGNGNGKTASSSGAQLYAIPSEKNAIDFSSEAKVAELITAYRERGRLLANINPLEKPPASHPLLELSNFNLTENDLDRHFTAARLLGLSGAQPLRKILEKLKETYCSSIAVEFTHIQNPEARAWLCEYMEKSNNKADLSPETQKYIYRRLTESETFERFLHTRYVAQKRFSLEGGESLIPCLDRIIDVSSEYGMESLVVGMAHRGRLNVLRNIFGKNPEYILTEFEQNYQYDSTMDEGDVKYHMGHSADINSKSGNSIHLSLAYNPSHLEFVNPVVVGIARAKQKQLNDTERNKVIPVLIHGDAAFAGQGIVYETLNLSEVEGYKVGGTIHIVIDNQVGFTTNPVDSRSTTYSTDMAKMLEVPIFHVNSDDAEAVWYVTKLATLWRQKFHKDVVIDLICYRKYGHNEGDEPSYTQPLMYKKIKAHPSTRELYAKKLEAQKVMSSEETQKEVDRVIEEMTQAQQKTRSENPKPFNSSYERNWKTLRKVKEDQDIFAQTKTSVAMKNLKEIGMKISQWPDSFTPHQKLIKIFEARKEMIHSGQNLDWAMGELLAYGSLLSEGHDIRMTGQDVERGTFGHRNAVLNNFENGSKYTSLNHIQDNQGAFIIYNSTLSESGVLGFEYGWSLTNPNALVIWEAQFGDFSNGAQVIIDQFICSAEYKWNRASGLVMLLPHGYEGQGPEHSSARLERFLQLCAKNNMAVCNLTTPAQIFHALRRQLKRDFRKPLIIMSPKSLLRNPAAVSPLKDFTEGGFEEVLDDVSVTAKGIKKIILCSGKIYYELLAERTAKKREDIALIRVEQLYPLATHKIESILKKYPKSAKITWVQEEPKNMGAWTHLVNYWYGNFNAEFETAVKGRELLYIGRERSASPAVGSVKLHAKEQKEILEKAIS